MEEVEEEKRPRDEELEEVITSKSASPKEGRQAGLAVPALPLSSKKADKLWPYCWIFRASCRHQWDV